MALQPPKQWSPLQACAVALPLAGVATALAVLAVLYGNAYARAGAVGSWALSLGLIARFTRFILTGDIAPYLQSAGEAVERTRGR